MGPLITVPDSSDGTQTHGHRSTETYRHPLILADRGCGGCSYEGRGSNSGGRCKVDAADLHCGE